jgi:hypothetical protein
MNQSSTGFTPNSCFPYYDTFRATVAKIKRRGAIVWGIRPKSKIHQFQRETSQRSMQNINPWRNQIIEKQRNSDNK